MSVLSRLIVCGVLFGVPVNAFAQTGPNPSGHWKGVLDVPAAPLDVEVDLVRSDVGEYFGVVSIPAQGVVRVPLSSITVTGTAVSFQIIQSTPGDNLFQMVLGSDDVMTGSFAHSPYTMNLRLARAGAAQMTPPARSSSIDAALEGRWQGVLAIEGRALRVELILASDATGIATATLVSLDQNNVQIPVTSVTQRGPDVQLDVRRVGAVFSGVYNATAGSVSGSWIEGGVSVPLVFTKARAESR